MAGKKITELISGSIQNLPLSGTTAVVYSGTTFQHNLTHLRQILVDSGSHNFTGSQHISGSLTISESSNFGSRLNNSHTFTGSVVVTGSVYSETMFAKEFLYVSGFAVIGDPIHHTGSDPEALHVGTKNSYNIAHFKGDNEYYSQVYISNHNSGSNASSDLVIVADNGTETNHYIDLGINSSTYTGGLVGGENDAYLLNVGKDLYVGTVGGSEHPAKLFLFAENNWENPQVTVHTGSQVTFNTPSFTEGYMYEFSGSIKSQDNLSIDGSLNIGSVNEKIVLEVSGGTSSYEFNYNSGSVFYITSSLGNNVYNVSNVPTENNQAISITFIVKQELTPYIASLYKLNDDEVTVSWAGNEQPIGNINKTDVIGLTALRVGSSWNVLGTFTTFG
jgi:hypothetical protein